MNIRVEDLGDDGLTVIYLEGRLDSYTNKILEDRIDKLLSQEKINLLFDLSKLDYINSSALGSLIATIQRTRLLGGSTSLCGAQGKVAYILKITKVESQMTVFESVEEAIRANRDLE